MVFEVPPVVGFLGRRWIGAIVVGATLWSGGGWPVTCLRSVTQRLVAQEPAVGKPEEAKLAEDMEKRFLAGVRQLTFEGKRSGEGYYAADGKQMVFQSEREVDNPFYQIYWMDMETGDSQRVSPGYGKTTCAWIHPSGQTVLFASTQFDPDARKKMEEELAFRASGQTRRYAWDYDATYDLVEWDRATGQYRRLTDAVGYDAEASYSPDGQWIVFASNRGAYSGELSESQKQLFEQDPSSAVDLYLMRRDGTQVRRLTDVSGYDGGPFFSPDGQRICWRRFSENGATAEIFTMAIDGSDVRALTKLGAMSWAPFYHPSGDYLIFASNLEGFSNFELYLVDAKGEKTPVRVTTTEGFDGLPVFSPDGNHLTWTSNRTASKSSQLFTATWDDAQARRALEIDSRDAESTLAESSMESDRIAGGEAARATAADFTAADIGRHVDYLCRPELGGRLTGTPGEAKATAYVASYLEGLGLEPAGVDGSWYQSFPFTAGVTLGEANRLAWGETTWKLNEDWRPVSFSRQGEVASAPVVFAGYGIVAPEDEGQPGYDSYVHLDVEGKWVIVYRQMPMDVSPERRQHLARYSGLRYKAMAARDRGAVGLIVVSGPTSGIREPLVPLQMDGTLAGSSLAVISISDNVADSLLKAGKSEESLEAMQKFLDRGELMMGFPLEGVALAATIDVQQIKKEGRNVLGWIRAGSQPSPHVVVVGAHIDHLGTGQGGSSLARDEERGGTHRGADDNASGVAGMLEIAQFLAAQKRSGKLSLKHDILFAAWSGEELGLLGSDYFAEQFDALYPSLRKGESGEKAAAESSEGEGEVAAAPTATGAVRLAPTVAACFNLDMIGRLREKLVLQGVGSSPLWTQEIEQRNAVVGLSLTLQSDSYLPTDASTFFMAGVPILSAFTGSHGEYHTPRDTPDLINYEGAAQVARLMGLIARSVSTRPEPPEYVAQAAPENQGKRAMLTAFLGTVPDYAQGDIQGVKLSGVAKNGPAATAGVQGGDVIVELAGKKIENVYDYTFAIEGLRVGQETEIVVQRGDQTLRLKVIPASRQ